MNYWLLAILVVVSYFVGNLSFGRIFAKAKQVDITKKGSGNPGATNVFRNVSHKWGYLTLLCDALKGIIPSFVGYAVFGFGTEGLIALYSCGLAAVVGHIFPVLYKFKGGKGVSTVIGVFLVAQPIPMLVLFLFAFVFVLYFKYLSLASLLIVSIMVIWQNVVEMTYSPFAINAVTEPNLAISLLTFALFLLVWYAHRGNIERLLMGNETKTNISKKLEKDTIKKQKLVVKAEEHAEKFEQKFEKKEEKEGIKSEIKCAKQEIKQEKKHIKSIRKQIKKNEKENQN